VSAVRNPRPCVIRPQTLLLSTAREVKPDSSQIMYGKVPIETLLERSRERRARPSHVTSGGNEVSLRCERSSLCSPSIAAPKHTKYSAHLLGPWRTIYFGGTLSPGLSFSSSVFSFLQAPIDSGTSRNMFLLSVSTCPCPRTPTLSLIAWRAAARLVNTTGCRVNRVSVAHGACLKLGAATELLWKILQAIVVQC